MVRDPNIKHSNISIETATRNRSEVKTSVVTLWKRFNDRRKEK